MQRADGQNKQPLALSITSIKVLIGIFSVPVILGLALGWHNAGLGGYMSKWSSITMWIGHLLTFWLCVYIVTILVSKLLSSYVTSVPAQLAIGSFLTLIVARPIFWASYQFRVAYIVSEGADSSQISKDFTWFEPSFKFLGMVADLYFIDVLVWFITAYFAHRLWGLPFVTPPREGETLYQTDSLEKTEVDTIPFLDRLGSESGVDLLYIKAEGHYVNVVTSKGHEMLHYRFGDVVSQLGHLGYQTHRSFWVSKQAIQSPMSKIKSSEIQVENGDKIPISRMYRQSLKDQNKNSSP